MSEFKPLTGVHVLDFSHVIAGPLATFYLQQMGATVHKIESRTGGDVMRRGNAVESFIALNAGKQSIAMDLGDPADQRSLREMAASADVLVDSLRPGVLERHGLGAEAVRAHNPRIVYCAISGFGRRGPWASRPAYDHVIQAATGMALMAGHEGDAPIKTGFPVVDAASGMLAALAILAGLRERDRIGQGCFIDLAMTAASMQLMYPMSCDALTHGRVPARIGNQGYSRSPAADMFETQEGWIALGANTPRQFLALLKILDLMRLASDPALFDTPLRSDTPPEFLRAKDPARLRAELVTALARQRAADLETRCARANVPAARVRTIAEFAAESRASDGLATLEMCDGSNRVTSPGLGFRVY